MSLLAGRLEGKVFRRKVLCMFGIQDGEGSQEIKLFIKDQPFPFPVSFDFPTAPPGKSGSQKPEMGLLGSDPGLSRAGSFWRL